jgi:hypothetical protein
MPDENYAIVGTAAAASGNAAISLYESTTVAKTTTLVQVATATISAQFDSTSVNVAIFR